jgi:antitoxin PrlF
LKTDSPATLRPFDIENWYGVGFFAERLTQETQMVLTITSKGQITLPKPIRQALGVDYGGKVAFDLRGSQVIVTRADEASHEDPAIASFLALLAKDIRKGQNLCNLPDGLVQAMQAAATLPVDLGADIEGDVAL